MTNMTPAQAAQQNNRTVDGKYSTRPVGESEVEVLGSAVSPEGACPDCGSKMIGQYAPGQFVPGAYCSECPHEVADVVYETLPDDDGVTYEVTIDSEGTLRWRDEDGDTVLVVEVDNEEEWTSSSPLGDDESIRENFVSAILARDDQ